MVNDNRQRQTASFTSDQFRAMTKYFNIFVSIDYCFVTERKRKANKETN